MKRLWFGLFLRCRWIGGGRLVARQRRQPDPLRQPVLLENFLRVTRRLASLSLFGFRLFGDKRNPLPIRRNPVVGDRGLERQQAPRLTSRKWNRPQRGIGVTSPFRQICDELAIRREANRRHLDVTTDISGVGTSLHRHHVQLSPSGTVRINIRCARHIEGVSDERSPRRHHHIGDRSHGRQLFEAQTFPGLDATAETHHHTRDDQTTSKNESRHTPSFCDDRHSIAAEATLRSLCLDMAIRSCYKSTRIRDSVTE